MKRFVFAAAMIAAIAAPAFAEDVGVRVGPAGVGATVGESHEYRDRDRDRTTVIKEREPTDSKTVIKKEDELGNREKTVIHHDRD
jgi:opacity protein-like surface antigen